MAVMGPSIAQPMAAGVGNHKSQVFRPTCSTLGSLTHSKVGRSALKAPSYTPATAVYIGPANEAARLTHWSASISQIVHMVGRLVSAAQSSPMFERKRPGRSDRRCAGIQTRTPPTVSRSRRQRTARRDSRRACLLHRHRGLGQFARGCTPCGSDGTRRRRSADVLRRKFRSRVRTRLRCAAGRSPAGMAPAAS